MTKSTRVIIGVAIAVGILVLLFMGISVLVLLNEWSHYNFRP